MKELICIECPKGCKLSIDENLVVTGNSCIRGKNYAINELVSPKRILTSTVVIVNASIPRLPVISNKPVPKDKIFQIMEQINQIRVSAPIKIHDIIIKNVCNLDIDIVASRTLEKI